ncbi:MAG TPA: MarR family transcriptional regulator [Amycolatopsis sp.]|uniref:MarR family winged helix-turn-helix transcriptional regulator n=1 Tax=Amycolatopsis sp. TaxID=37632 RepID=UPI002B49DCDD|nr:MarR family transcriptional regulator [Amycolatopsis sp.]HKS49157.1 MarR family transcriptional regulator [Amycolatopsis sp.]
MATPRWLDDRETRLWRAHLELGRELQKAFESQLSRDARLSGAEYALLVPLSEAADGVVRMRDLCRAVGWDRSRLSHQVRRMEKRGLVMRAECPEDARGAMARLTEAGRTAIEARRAKARRNGVSPLLRSVVHQGLRHPHRHLRTFAGRLVRDVTPWP